MKPTPLHVSPAPARAIVRTGPEADAMHRTASQITAKGRAITQRTTKLTDGVRYLLQLHAAKTRSTNEVWYVAVYHAEQPHGHQRRVLVDPQGRCWTLFPATQSDPARCIHGANKYRSHLTQIADSTVCQTAASVIK